MRFYINVIEIVLGVLLTTAILLQARGAGLGGIFGGEGNIYQTKRGFERILFISTIVLAALFLGTALVNILI